MNAAQKETPGGLAAHRAKHYAFNKPRVIPPPLNVNGLPI